MLLLSLLLSTAYAQDADPVPAAAQAAVVEEDAAPAVETLWIVGQVSMVRWPGAAGDDNPAVKSLDDASAVTVVYREGDQVRVRSGGDFGWVLASELTDVGPVLEELPAAGGLLDGLNLGGLGLGGLGLGDNPFSGLPPAQ